MKKTAHLYRSGRIVLSSSAALRPAALASAVADCTAATMALSSASLSRSASWGRQCFKHNDTYSAHLQQATGARVECIACSTCCMKRTLVERLMIARAAKSALSAMTRTATDDEG